MVNKKGVGILTIFLFLMIIPLTIAQSPFETQEGEFTKGYVIEDSLDQNLQFGKDYEFNFHVYNKSNGVPITNTTTSCHFTLYNITGEKLIEKEPVYNDSSIFPEWSIKILGGNFTNKGQHHVTIQCNSTVPLPLGGFNSMPIQVTNTGLDFTESKGLVSIGILFAALFLSMIFSGVGKKLTEKDATAPLSIIFIGLSFVLGIYALYLSYAYSVDIVEYGSLAGLTEVVFLTFIWVMVGIAIISMTLMLISFIKELSRVLQTKKFGEGYNPITKTYE